MGFRIRFARARERFESNGRRKAAVRRSARAGPPALLLLERACGRTRKSHDLSRRSRPILRSLAEAMWLEATPMSHALGVTLACLWDVPERACGRRWRKSIPPSAVARRAMADKKARSTPRSPEHAAYGGSRDDPATSLPRTSGAVRVPSCGGVPPTACRQGSPD